MSYIKGTGVDTPISIGNGYLKATYVDIMAKTGTVFLFIYFVLPQYFGLRLPGFDFTAQRIGIVFVFLILFEKSTRMRQFLNIVKSCSLLPLLGIYLFILLYTAAVRKHIGTFLYSLIELIALFMMVYFIREVLGVSKVMRLLVCFSYLLCLLGLIEYVMGRSPFSYLETIKGLYTGVMIRSGSYRIMGPCNHALGYGLVLVTIIPFACYNDKADKLDMAAHWPLLLLIMINVLLTGSRSTLAVSGLELVLFFLFSSKNDKKKIILAIVVMIFALAAVTALTIHTSFGRYIMLQVTSVIDEIFGTSYAIRFGADKTTLENSSVYRELLLDIFHVDWLNPWLGRGSGYVFYWYYQGYYIKSIDNFYIANYIRYGYPGMVAYILIILFTLCKMLVGAIKKKSSLCKCMFIGTLCYFINLWWLDTLQTIKYAYILFAFYYAIEERKIPVKKSFPYKSKYIR